MSKYAYTVYEGYDSKPVLVRQKIKKATPTRIWFTKRAGLAFDCRMYVSPAACRVPMEAWKAYRRALRAELRRVESLKKTLALADAMIAKHKGEPEAAWPVKEDE